MALPDANNCLSFGDAERTAGDNATHIIIDFFFVKKVQVKQQSTHQDPSALCRIFFRPRHAVAEILSFELDIDQRLAR